MITEKEILATQLSPTKKDFYQIWNELLDTANKISTIWDPTSTNESDPGIVLLKVLTAIADKVNYNIDKNILEAFMPSATQEESMRKLCEMLGYSIKYYRSATTDVTITYTGSEKELGGFELPQFSEVSNSDGDIIYTTLEPASFMVQKSAAATVEQITTVSVPVVEGSIHQCETNTEDGNNVISLALLDDNYRYYLPENSIDENHIFVYNYADSASRTQWEKVDNLNTVAAGSTVFKFGFDSKYRAPYLQFPEDINALIGDGLQIWYIRTSGSNGNISAGTLSTISSGLPTVGEIELTTDMFTVINNSAAQNGADVETLNQAYNNYKKTIGTFDTLVTCRDYMNKIYQLAYETSAIPLVSNDIVTDIRDDINRAKVLCTFDKNGIAYVEEAVVVSSTPRITNFDLVLYPFRTVYGLNTQDEYNKSFNYTKENADDIEEALSGLKTISHRFKYPEAGDITCIKNYLKLNARITTTYKVNSVEETSILTNIYKAIYKNFNARLIDFGEEIPFDSIQSTIENADERIKNVALDEPELVTAIQRKAADGSSQEIEEYIDGSGIAANQTEYNKLLNKILLNNILAGRVKLFNYVEDFKPAYTDRQYTEYQDAQHTAVAVPVVLPTKTTDGTNRNQHITEVRPYFEFPLSQSLPYTLTEGEVISFRAPNFRTTITYPAYVNYYLHLVSSGNSAVPATFKTFKAYLLDDVARVDLPESCFTNTSTSTDISASVGAETEPHFKKVTDTAGYHFERDASGTYKVKLDDTTFINWANWVMQQDSKEPAGEGTYKKLLGIFRRTTPSLSRVIGDMVDAEYRKYIKCDYYHSDLTTLESYWIQDTCAETTTTQTANGLGLSAELDALTKDTEYQLKTNEYLLINYTQSSSSEYNASDTGTVINKEYGAGTIIKPNFTLDDSARVAASGVSYTKTNQREFEFGAHQPAGMFSFDANEQIEIREFATVCLSDDDTKKAYIYWVLNNEEKDSTGMTAFPFVDGKYTLQENEYFFVTDQDQLEMVYYGQGTEIEKIGNWESPKKKAEESSSAEIVEQILTQGLSVVPWVYISGIDSSTKDIKATEYQYINLVAGDKLDSITKATGETATYLTSNYNCAVTGATYITADTTDTAQLGVIDVINAGWKAASRLELNVGPEAKQTLQNVTTQTRSNVTVYTERIELYGYKGDTRPTDSSSIVLLDNSTIHGVKETSGETISPISIKTNYAVQSGSSKIDTKVTEYSGTIETAVDDFKMEQYKYEALAPAGASTPEIALNNYGQGKHWTSIALNKITTYLEFQTMVQSSDNFGLIMFYYSSSLAETTTTNRPYLATDAGTLTIFNHEDGGWWSGWSSTNYLRNGINIVKIPYATKSVKLYSNGNTTDSVVMSDMDIIKTETNNSYGFNINMLDYRATTEGTIAEQLATDLRAADLSYNFYYNCLMDNSTAIDLNDLVDEKLSDPTNLYDYNNLNNKFVISEISDSDMRKGITIARSSKI